MSLREKRILVSGSNGFIGSHLVDRLQEGGANITKLDFPIDIRNWEKVKSFENVKGIDIVYHLAAISSVPYSWEDPRSTYETNILGTLNILELCRLYNIKRFVFISSYVYGIPKYLPIDEKHPIGAVNPYNISKILAEELCISYSKFWGLSCVILRPFNIYGKRQNPEFLIPSICNQIVRKGKIVLADSVPKRDFLYIDDMVNACVKVGLYKKTGLGIFNIGSGKSYSVKDVVEKIVKIYGKKVKTSYTNTRRKNEIMDIYADIRKAKAELNWSPKVVIDDGLRKCLKWKK